MGDDTQYLTQDKIDALEVELKKLKEDTIPGLAKRIDDARSMGDLSENAEYHAAREDMSWAQTRAKEVRAILDNAEIIHTSKSKNSVQIGHTIKVKVNGKSKTYTIVGAQEANPLEGKISNESPLGSAFLGKHVGDKVEVSIPAGVQIFEITDIA